jgi:hypothetical protein
MPDLSTAETHDERVARQVLSDLDEIARQVGPTQGLPPGSRKLTQEEEDAIWDSYDEAMVAEIPAMQAQGMPDLMIATMVFPKRMQLIKRGRPTLTEQATYAAEMAKRADERLAGQQEQQQMPTDLPAPDPQMDQMDALPPEVA